MRLIACYYPFDIPCKLDVVGEIYINIYMVIMVYCQLPSDQSCLSRKSNYPNILINNTILVISLSH